MSALVLFHQEGLSCSITDEAAAICESALSRSALVGAVRSDRDNEVASAAQADLKSLIDRIEEARKVVKEPFLEACRAIDRSAKDATTDLKAEYERLGKSMGDWQSEQLEKVREAERQRQAEIAKIEAQRREELERLEAERKRKEAEAAALAEAELRKARGTAAKKAAEARAKQEADRIAEEAAKEAQRLQELRDQEITALAPVAVPVRAEGQTVRPRWEFEVIDIWKLVRTNPGLVRVEVNRSEINQAIEALAEAMGTPVIPGLRIWRETQVGVRLPKAKVLDV